MIVGLNPTFRSNARSKKLRGKRSYVHAGGVNSDGHPSDIQVSGFLYRHIHMEPCISITLPPKSVCAIELIICYVIFQIYCEKPCCERCLYPPSLTISQCSECDRFHVNRYNLNTCEVGRSIYAKKREKTTQYASLSPLLSVWERIMISLASKPKLRQSSVPVNIIRGSTSWIKT